jgi:formylglycine-generating enzyme required for sulfatase activity
MIDGMRPLLPGLLLAVALGARGEAGAGGGKVVRVERDRPSVVEIDGGVFTMGIDRDDVEYAQLTCTILHGQNRTSVMQFGFTGLPFCDGYREMLLQMLPREVFVSDFAIDRHEVSLDQYRECVLDSVCGIDPLIDGDERYQGDGLPLVNVTWSEARTYCDWRGGRLPTEAEWERAARGDDDRRWPWGDQDRPDDFNHGQLPAEATAAVDDLSHRNTGAARFNVTAFADVDEVDGHRYAAPVGSYLWGEGPHGTFDQAGNVAEWVEDELTSDGYYDLPAADPVRTPGGSPSLPRVIRGGSWRDPQMFGWVAVRAPINIEIEGTQRHPHVGFRCAYDR